MNRKQPPRRKVCSECRTADQSAFAAHGRQLIPICRACAAKKRREYDHYYATVFGRGRRHARETVARRNQTRTLDEIDDKPPLPPEEEREKILERLIEHPEF